MNQGDHFHGYPHSPLGLGCVVANWSFSVQCTKLMYEGCSLILVIDLFSPKPASATLERYLVVINMFFAILKPPNNFRMKQLIVVI